MLSRLCFSNQADTSSSVSGECLHSQTKKEAISTPIATFPVDMLLVRLGKPEGKTVALEAQLRARKYREI